ncbi:uncharacterized protein SOCE26_005520 [Sorangium cellulosum]|uniref:Putative restriction endonuclease domain-containing protein n=1 Tax=Sorangium cellulosum TaxID=56 RepID=A0A2L0EIP6_SORCE|nr:uncharacterized protein SOCE26_005520 [Sorangium cellulosum]
MTFCEGTLELMRPSLKHEATKKSIARLIEIFAVERDVPLYGHSSTSFRREAKARGLEPDECYCVGGTLKEFPDIATEVMLTNGGLDKLPVYSGLGVREVWFWERALHDRMLRTGVAKGSPHAGRAPSACHPPGSRVHPSANSGASRTSLSSAPSSSMAAVTSGCSATARRAASTRAFRSAVST